MIESAAYDVIKQEGLSEGLQSLVTIHSSLLLSRSSWCRSRLPEPWLSYEP